MLEEKAKEIIKALPFCKHLTYKIGPGGQEIFFYYESKRFTRPIFLRGFHKNNFDKNNKFYRKFEDVLSKIKSEYYYLDNKPIIKIEKV